MYQLRLCYYEGKYHSVNIHLHIHIQDITNNLNNVPQSVSKCFPTDRQRRVVFPELSHPLILLANTFRVEIDRSKQGNRLMRPVSSPSASAIRPWLLNQLRAMEQANMPHCSNVALKQKLAFLGKILYWDCVKWEWKVENATGT